MSIIADFVYNVSRTTDQLKVPITLDMVNAIFDHWISENAMGRAHILKLEPRDEARRRISYRLGGSDRIMGERIGITGPAFSKWRDIRGLPTKGTRGPIPMREVG